MSCPDLMGDAFSALPKPRVFHRAQAVGLPHVQSNPTRHPRVEYLIAIRYTFSGWNLFGFRLPLSSRRISRAGEDPPNQAHPAWACSTFPKPAGLALSLIGVLSGGQSAIGSRRLFEGAFQRWSWEADPAICRRLFTPPKIYSVFWIQKIKSPKGVSSKVPS